MAEIPHNPAVFFILDPLTHVVFSSRLLNYTIAWYIPGKVVSVVPKASPETMYLIDIEENNGQMSCTCDNYMFARDPNNRRNLGKHFEPCKHIILVKLALQYSLTRVTKTG